MLVSARAKHETKFVHDITEFKTHVQTHIQNVTKLGLYLYYQHPNEFGEIPEHILREKLRYHDYEKVADLETLRALGYDGKKPFAERLFAVYGQHFAKTRFRNLEMIDQLNHFGELFEEQVLRKHNLLGEKSQTMVEKLRMIERIADLVEREMNPISPEEFGVRKMQKAEAFLRSEKERRLARNLAQVYHQIVRPNPLIYIVKSNALPKTLPHGSCSRLFN